MFFHTHFQRNRRDVWRILQYESAVFRSNSHWCCNHWTFLFRIVFYQFSRLFASWIYFENIKSQADFCIWSVRTEFPVLVIDVHEKSCCLLDFYNHCLLCTGNTFYCFWQYYSGLYRFQISCYYIVRCFYAAYLHYCSVLWNYGKSIWPDLT